MRIKLLGQKIYRCFVMCSDMHYGADDGNRTHITSLEGWDSTIELHPLKSYDPNFI